MIASFGLFSIKCFAQTGISNAPGTLYTGTVMLGIMRRSSSMVVLSIEFTNSSLYRLATILIVRLVPMDLGFGASGVEGIGIEVRLS